MIIPSRVVQIFALLMLPILLSRRQILAFVSLVMVCQVVFVMLFILPEAAHAEAALVNTVSTPVRLVESQKNKIKYRYIVYYY